MSVVIGKCELFNEDCMEVMRRYPDKYFDLACVDPPYGLGETLVAGGTWSVKYQAKGAAWDVAPGREYFDELRRVSAHQIIWGGITSPNLSRLRAAAFRG